MTNSKQPFTNARLMAVQAYYARALSNESWDQIISRFLMEEIGGNSAMFSQKQLLYFSYTPGNKANNLYQLANAGVNDSVGITINNKLVDINGNDIYTSNKV